MQPLLLIHGVALSALAHQAPVPIALWGGFAPAAASCQRVVSRVAAQCATTAWRVSDTCSATQVAGGRCDAAATRIVVNQVHAAARAVAERACVGVDLLSMGFASLVDVDADVDLFCQQLEDAMVSALYLPAMQNGVIGSTNATTRACVTATANTATHLLYFAFRERRHTLDRIAAVAAGPQQKLALIKRSSARIRRVQVLSSMRLQALCPDFAPLYGRNASVLLTLVAERADCLAGRTYVQDALTCPLSVCGNGMREVGEDCDDGNLINGDGCDESCSRERP